MFFSEGFGAGGSDFSLKTGDGRVFLGRVKVARGPFERMRGLIGCRSLPPECGLLLPHCRAVHTFFMSIAIDVVFLDSDMSVCEIAASLAPWRIAVCRAPEAVHTLETAAGAAARFALARGERLFRAPPIQ